MIQHIKNFLFQQYEERIEKLPQQDKLRKNCTDAGFLSVVENGQYFMTKDTGDFNTIQYSGLPFREKIQHHNRKDGSKGTPKLVTTSYLHGKHGVESRIWSLSKDNTHSWVRISNGQISL